MLRQAIVHVSLHLFFQLRAVLDMGLVMCAVIRNWLFACQIGRECGSGYSDKYCLRAKLLALTRFPSLQVTKKDPPIQMDPKLFVTTR
jgi:hypothetical protein